MYSREIINYATVVANSLSLASDDDYACVLVALCAIFKNKFKKKKTRKVWVKEWLKRRPDHGHSSLLRELSHEVEDYRNLLRMNKESFMELLAIIAPSFLKMIPI